MLAIQCMNATKYFNEKLKKNGHLLKNLKPGGRKKRFAAVDNVSFDVRKGEIFGILGPNGSGKSTLIRMLSTLVLPDKGELRIFGMDVTKETIRVRRQINRVSVDAAFFKKLSAWENLSYAARLYGVNPSKVKGKAIEILENLRFSEDTMYQPLENLSRGMQQKVAIARALLTTPVLLLLDEPTTGLDPVSKRQVQEYILRVQREHDTTVLLTSHDLEEVERVCERVAIINEGCFIACDTPEKLKAACSNNGRAATLEQVFFKMTGIDLYEDAVAV